MNVRESNGPKMDQVFFLHRISLMLDGIQSSLHVDGIPHNDRVRQEMQASRLIGLAVLRSCCKIPQASRFSNRRIMQIWIIAALLTVNLS
jgi:hypothetical protein